MIEKNSKIIYFVHVMVKKHDIYKLLLFKIIILNFFIKWAENKRENKKEKDSKNILKF
jgi:hypothetical protein